MTDSFAEDQSSVLSFRAKIWEMTYALRSFAVAMNWRSSINCTTTALMIEQSSLFIVPSIWCTQPKILLLQFTKLETVWRYILIKNRHKAINILQHTNVLSLYTKNIKPILRWPKGSCKTYEIPFPKYFFLIPIYVVCTKIKSLSWKKGVLPVFQEFSNFPKLVQSSLG